MIRISQSFKGIQVLYLGPWPDSPSSNWTVTNLRASIPILEKLKSSKPKVLLISPGENGYGKEWDLNSFLDSSSKEIGELFSRWLDLVNTLKSEGTKILFVLDGNIKGLPLSFCLCATHILGSSSALLEFTLPNYGLLPPGLLTYALSSISPDTFVTILTGRKKQLQIQGDTSFIISEITSEFSEVNASRISSLDLKRTKHENKWLDFNPSKWYSLSYKRPFIKIAGKHFSSSYTQLLTDEKETLQQILETREWKNRIRTVYKNTQNAKTAAFEKPIDSSNPPSKIGIIGAGMMGTGIAYISAVAGIECVLCDKSHDLNHQAVKSIQKLLEKPIEAGKISPDQADLIQSKIKIIASKIDLEDCDLIIEAVDENRLLKNKITADYEPLLPEDAIFATNTSTLPVSGLAKSSSRPENFIGIHFFSPVHKMNLVEIIKGNKTSNITVQKALSFVRHIDKIPIVVNDSRSFYTSRVFKTYIVEGFEMIAEGVKPELIEEAGNMAGMAIGPLAVADELSLQLLYTIYHQNARDGFIPQGKGMWVIDRFVKEFDRKGRKYGKGFYDYAENGKKLWPGISKHFPGSGSQTDIIHLKKRMLYIQALEALRCLEEGVIERIEDADIGSIWGWGFPSHTGGIISMIDQHGIATFLKEVKELHLLYGERFRPVPLLEKMVTEHKNFY